MPSTNFENLRVYRLAEELAAHIWEIVLQWNNFAKRTVGEQLGDAACGVGSNNRKERGVERLLTIVASFA